MTVSATEDRPLLGIGLMILALLMFTGIDICAKWLVEAGMPPAAVAWVRYTVHFLIVVAVFLPRDRMGLVRTQHMGLEVVRGLCLLGGTLLNFTAVKYLPLTLTAAIMFTAPLWVCALSVPLLGERVGPRRWAAILIGFSGILIITRPWGAELHWAVLLSVNTAVFASLYVIFTRKLAGRDRTSTQQFYASGLATVILAPLAALNWGWPQLPLDWLAFAMIGVFGWAGHQFLTVAHRYAPASTLAPFVYVQIIYMTTASWLVFHDVPDPWVLVGAGVVLVSGVYIWLREQRLARA